MSEEVVRRLREAAARLQADCDRTGKSDLVRIEVEEVEMPPRPSPADFPPDAVARAAMWRERNREAWSLEWCCVVYEEGERRAWMPGYEGWSAEGHVARVADIVQDAIIECRADWGEPWPRCPSHLTHPMSIAMVDDVAVWTCRDNPSVKIRVGELQAG